MKGQNIGGILPNTRTYTSISICEKGIFRSHKNDIIQSKIIGGDN